MKIDPNEPICICEEAGYLPHHPKCPSHTRTKPPIQTCAGLTIRAEIASRCLQGILSKGHDFAWAYEESAQLSIKFADALISELNKE